MLLKVNNMTCGGCVSSVQRILVRQLELSEDQVKVDLDTASAEIPDVDDDRLQDALAKLEKAGFDSRPALTSGD